MKLPKENYRWISVNKIGNLEKFVEEYDEDSDKGYILSVDLAYPKNLHDKHEAYPLAPHTAQIKFDNLSPYAQKVLLENGGKKNFKCEKLIASFLTKTNYVVHIQNLKFYLKQGLKLLKVNRILEFTQEAFLKPYIDLCTKKRQQANNPFQKNLFKGMCNNGEFNAIIYSIN